VAEWPETNLENYSLYREEAGFRAADRDGKCIEAGKASGRYVLLFSTKYW